LSTCSSHLAALAMLTAIVSSPVLALLRFA
jgi:hypothetical protein